MEDPSPPPSADDSDPNPRIGQNVDGNDNQAIGQAIDSTIVNFAGDGQVINLTINDRIPTASLPPLNIVVQNLTQQEYRQRQVLLNKVRDAWVKGVLEKSLHARVSIELGLQERPDLVQQPFSDVAEFAAAPGQALPEGTPATTVFDRLGSGRTLLIVGEPGSGKTIALLKLAEDAIDRTEPDLRQQIPVVFNLSSWARKPQTIEQWLIQELLEKYQVSKALGKTWVESEALMLLLDGLDEVKAEQRNTCVQALNQFMQTHGTTEIVICCRIGDYQMLQDRLTLRSAICLQPLTATQIDLYFEQAGDRLSALKAVLLQDAELQELAKSPLMLSVMSLAYQDFTPEQLTVGGKIEDYRRRLFATYIDRMFQRRGTAQKYSREDTERWLIWLAQRMKVASQSEFLIEGLQPSWLANKVQQICYQWGNIFILVLPVGLIVGIVYEKIFGLTVGLIVGLIAGLMYLIWLRLEKEIKTFEVIKWSWQEVKSELRAFPPSNSWLVNLLILSLVDGLLIGFVFFWISNHKLSFGIYWLHFGVFWLMGGLMGGLFILLLSGFQVIKIDRQRKPNHGIFASAKNATIIAIVVTIVGIALVRSTLIPDRLIPFDLANNPNLTNSQMIAVLFAGLVTGFICGGNACLQHFLLRLILYNRYAPWNYARFLDYATERIFLHNVGGGYIFIHRMLLEHFAEMSLEQENN